MKITVNKKDLSQAISDISRAVSTRASTPILEGILMEADYTGVRLTAFSTDLGIITNISVKTDKCGSAVLPAKILLEITKKSPNDDVKIDVNEKFIAKITSGNSRHTIIGMNPKDFPEIPQHKSEQVFNLEGLLLKSMIRQTLYAVSQNDSKPVHTGSLFSLKNGILDVVSVDGSRMALRRENVTNKENLSFVVPSKSLAEILRLSHNEDVKIMLSRRHVTFVTRDYTIVSSILEGEFLEYKKAISINPNCISIIKTKELIEAVERVSIINTETYRQALKCNFVESEIQLETITSTGNATDSINHKMQGDDILIGFNGKYLLEALKNTECDEVELCLSGKLNPIIIKPIMGESFIFMVLPVRLREVN